MTIAEGRAVVETARRYGRVYQTGTQRLSEPNHVFCIEMARTGRLGKIHTAYAHIAPWDAAEMRHDWLPAVPEPPKDEIDWDAWLGPCPWRPYNPAYVAGGWRGHYDFHTSCIGEWGAHTFAQAQAGLDCSESSPIEYEYVPNDSGDGMVAHFANGVRLILREATSTGTAPAASGSTAAKAGPRPPTATASPTSPRRPCSASSTASSGSMSPAPPIARPHAGFPRLCPSRQRAVANPEVMHHSMTTVHAANICMWLKRSLKFDPVKEEFVGDEEANRLRSRAMREPYTI